MYSLNTQLSPTNSLTPCNIISPTNAKDKNRVNIIIKDSNDEVIRRICIDPSLYIRQVKLDISRMKFMNMNKPLECFVLSYKGKVVDDSVCIKTLMYGEDLELRLTIVDNQEECVEETNYSYRAKNEASVFSSSCKRRSVVKEVLNRDAYETVRMKASSFIRTGNITGFFEWVSSASLEEEQLISVIEIARQGFSVHTYGKKLFSLLEDYISLSCTNLKGPAVITSLLQWYRIIFMELKNIELKDILIDLLLVLYTYMSEKKVVQSCINSYVVISELPFPDDALEIVCSGDYSYNFNNVIKLYCQETWIASVFQVLLHLVENIKTNQIEQLVSYYHLSLLSAVLTTNQNSHVFTSLCSYLVSLAHSPLPSSVFLNSDIFVILASILKECTKDDTEKIYAIVNVFTAFSERSDHTRFSSSNDMSILLVESNIAVLIPEIMNMCSANRSIVQSMVLFIHSLCRSTEICCYLYLTNILYALQICMSVYRDSDLKIIKTCYSIYHLLFLKNQVAMQYITVEDIDLIMYYLQQYSKESDFIIVLLKLLNVLMEKNTFYHIVKMKKNVKILENVRQTNQDENKVVILINQILNKPEYDFIQNELEFELPTKDIFYNSDLNGEQVLSSHKLCSLLIWRLTHSKNHTILEASVQVLSLILSNIPPTNLQTLSYLPGLLYPVVQEIDDSFQFNKAIVTILYLIISNNQSILLPSSFMKLLLDRMLKHLFSYEIMLHTLQLLQYVIALNPSFLQDEDVIITLQRTLYATHSIPCRNLITSFLKDNTLKGLSLPSRNDHLDETLFSATIFQLSSSDEAVVKEGLKICTDAMKLSPSVFIPIFINENGWSKLLELLRTVKNVEIFPLIYQLIQVLLADKDNLIQDANKLSLVVVLYRVIRENKQNREIVKQTLQLIKTISTIQNTANRIISNIDTLFTLLTMYSKPSQEENIVCYPIVEMVCDLLTQCITLNTKNIQTIRAKGFVNALSVLLSQIHDTTCSVKCFELFLLLKGEEDLPLSCNYLIQPCLSFLQQHQEESFIQSPFFFQILTIFIKIMENDSSFRSHFIHSTLLIPLGKISLSLWCDSNNKTILNYLTQVCTVQLNQSLVVTTGILDLFINQLQQDHSQMEVEDIINILSFFFDISSNLYVQAFLHNHLSLFIRIISYFFSNATLLELSLSLIHTIITSKDTSVLTEIISLIQQHYSTHKDILDLTHQITEKLKLLDTLNNSSLLQNACLVLLSSSEIDIATNFDLLIKLLLDDDVTEAIIPEIEGISSVLLDWLVMDGIVKTCLPKAITVLISIIQLYQQYQPITSITHYITTLCYLLYQNNCILDNPSFQTCLQQIFKSYPSDLIHFGIMLLNWYIIQPTSQIQPVKYYTQQEEMLSILTTVHFIECLLTHLAFTSNSEERMTLLSIVSYLTEYQSIVQYIAKEPACLAMISNLKVQNNLEKKIILQIVETVESQLSMEELEKAVIQQFGDLPEGNAPECI